MSTLSEVDVVNAAMYEIGHSPIASIAASTPESIMLPLARDELLRQCFWQFARKFATLSGGNIVPVASSIFDDATTIGSWEDVSAGTAQIAFHSGAAKAWNRPTMWLEEAAGNGGDARLRLPTTDGAIYTVSITGWSDTVVSPAGDVWVGTTPAAVDLLQDTFAATSVEVGGVVTEKTFTASGDVAYLQLNGSDTDDIYVGDITVTTTNALSADYDFTYGLPRDFIRAVAITDRAEFKLAYNGANPVLLTDQSAPVLEYIARITDPTLWDDLFVDALVLLLASKLAMAILHSRALSREWFERAMLVIRSAQIVNAQDQNRPFEFSNDVLIRAGGNRRRRADKVELFY